MDSGWPVGCALAVSRLLSSIRRASRCHASIAGQRRIVSTPKCSFVCSWDGCVVSLVGERTRIINRMKAALIRLGIRGFKPELLKAPQRLEAQYTAEGVPIPPNMLEELRRDMARLAWVREQINAIEQARLERLEQAPSSGPHAMV